MKTMMIMFFSLLLVCLFAFTSCSQDFDKVSDEKIDGESFVRAERFIENFYAALRKGSHYEFGDEATPEVKNSITPGLQKQIHAQVKDQFGEFESADYVETWMQKATPEYKIMRYKGKYSNSNTRLEIRVVLDDEDKIAGFFIKPWSDMLN